VSNKLSRASAIVAALALAAIASPVAAADDAMVRVLHGSPDAPAVDVYVNDAPVGAPLADLEFGELSAYVPLAAGTYDLKVCATADPAVCPIVLNDTPIAAGTHYTIAATGVLASITPQVITDEPDPKAGKAEARVVHFSADTPAVDVLTDANAVVVSNLSYPDKTGYLPLDPGAYDLKVCATGTTDTCPLDIEPPLTLEAGTSYSVFAIGSFEGETLTYAVGVDGVYAPPTDTLGVTPASPSSPALPLLLVAAGLASFLGVMRLATSRARR
jgi:hypothetical protein